MWGRWLCDDCHSSRSLGPICGSSRTVARFSKVWLLLLFLSRWSNVEEEGALRNFAGFGGGTSSGLHLAVQRAKGGEILAAKSSCIIFFFFFLTMWQACCALFYFFTRALVVTSCAALFRVHRLCVCFLWFFFCVCVGECVHCLCNVYEVRWLHLIPPFSVVGTSAFGFSFALKKNYINVL